MIRDLLTGRGSSPLTRGKQVGAGFRRLRGRLIPAHAGKTPTRAATRLRARAHPRSRGENLEGLAGLLSGLGSSPLTRGKRCPMLRLLARVGLIPAHAGKTCDEGPCC